MLHGFIATVITKPQNTAASHFFFFYCRCLYIVIGAVIFQWFGWDTNLDAVCSLQLSPAIVGGLHNMARSIECRCYTDGLNIHTHIVSNSNFSETSAFMPVLKVVLTQANKLGVWCPLSQCAHKPTSILKKPSSHHSARTSCAYILPVLTDLVYS